MAEAANPYGLTKEELSQIDVATKRAEAPNVNYMAGMLSGDAPSSNLGSQLQAQQTRVRGGQLNALTNALQARSARRDTSATKTALAASKAAKEQEAAKLKADALVKSSGLTDTRKIKAEKQEQLDELARIELRNSGKVSAAQKTATAQDKATRMEQYKVWAGQQPKATAMTEKSATDLQNTAELHGHMQRGLNNFDPKFVSNFKSMGELQNWISRNAGSYATPDMQAQAEWWRDYGKDITLEARHSMFGAAFTKNEEAVWDAADITIGMSPEELVKNLTKRAKVLQDHVSDRARFEAHKSKDAKGVQMLLGDFEFTGNPLDSGRVSYDQFLQESGGGAPAGPAGPAAPAGSRKVFNPATGKVE